MPALHGKLVPWGSDYWTMTPGGFSDRWTCRRGCEGIMLAICDGCRRWVWASFSEWSGHGRTLVIGATATIANGSGGDGSRPTYGWIDPLEVYPGPTGFFSIDGPGLGPKYRPEGRKYGTGRRAEQEGDHGVDRETVCARVSRAVRCVHLINQPIHVTAVAFHSHYVYVYVVEWNGCEPEPAGNGKLRTAGVLLVGGKPQGLAQPVGYGRAGEGKDPCMEAHQEWFGCGA